MESLRFYIGFAKVFRSASTFIFRTERQKISCPDCGYDSQRRIRLPSNWRAVFSEVGSHDKI